MSKVLRPLVPALAALAFALTACGGGGAVDDVKSWKEAACKCEDKDCATKQGKAFLELGKKYKDQDKPSKEDMEKLDKYADEGQECLEKLGVDVYDLEP